MASPGRPSLFTDELATRICERLAAGETLRTVCSDEEMPAEATVRSWALTDVNGFSAQYARAREIGYHSMFDQVLQIADTPAEGVTVTNKMSRDGDMYDETRHGDMIEHRRLQVDTRKWMLAKALPKIYGDRHLHEHSGQVDIAMTLDRVITEMREREMSMRSLPQVEDALRH